MSAIFGARDKNPPESVHIPQGYVVYQVTKVEPARTPSFEEIRARVEQEYKADKARPDAAAEDHRAVGKSALAARLEEGGQGSGRDGEDQRPGWTDRAGARPGVALRAGAGGLRDEAGRDQPAHQHRPQRSGRSRLLEKQEPPPAQFAASKDRLRDQLLQKKRNEFLEVFATNLQKQMEKSGKIKVNQQELKRITTPMPGSESGQ